MELILYFMGAFASAMIGVVLFGFILSILYAIGLSKIAKGLGLRHGWFAFFPLLNVYLLGDIVEYVEFGSVTIDNLKWIFPLTMLFGAVLVPIPILGFFVGLFMFILSFAMMHKLFAMYKPESAWLYTILSFILPFLQPIFVFSIRNIDPPDYLFEYQ